MTPSRFKWVRSVNCFQTTWAFTQLIKAECKYISITLVNYSAGDGEFLDLNLKNVQDSSVYKEPIVFLKKNSEFNLNSEHLL